MPRTFSITYTVKAKGGSVIKTKPIEFTIRPAGLGPYFGYLIGTQLVNQTVLPAAEAEEAMLAEDFQIVGK